MPLVLLGPQCPATQFPKASALGVTLERGLGYFKPPWVTGTANSEAQGKHCWLLPSSTTLQPPPHIPTHVPVPERRRCSLPRAGRSAPCRDIKVSAGMCVALPGCGRYGARDDERDTVMVISPSDGGEAERGACQQYLLLFLPSAALY